MSGNSIWFGEEIKILVFQIRTLSLVIWSPVTICIQSVQFNSIDHKLFETIYSASKKKRKGTTSWNILKRGSTNSWPTYECTLLKQKLTGLTYSVICHKNM